MASTRKKATLKFSCLTVTQGDYELVCFTVPARQLWSFVRVNERESNKDKGYQRALSASRVRAVADYIDHGNPIPNSILLSLNQGARLAKNRKSITIPNRAGAGWVIDGQHRLAGAKES